VNSDAPDAPMTARDWFRLSKVAIAEALEWEKEADDDPDAYTRGKSWRALAAKCHHRGEELQAGRVVP
jgi:hypothetical protein